MICGQGTRRRSSRFESVNSTDERREMTTNVEEVIEISGDILLPHLNPSDSENTDIDNSLNNLDHFEEIVYENLNEDHIIITQENTSDNTEEVVQIDSEEKIEDSDEIELESTLMAVMLPDGSTALIKNINEHIQYISDETDLIESQDNLITTDPLPSNENRDEVEKPKINLILEKSQDSSQNVHILSQQSIEISDQPIAFLSMDEKNEDSLKKKSDEFYYPMLQLEDGSTAYVSIPHELLPSMGLCLEEPNVNNEQQEEETKQIEVVQRPTTEEDSDNNLIVQISNNTSSEKEKRIRPRQFPCEYENCGKFYTTMHHLKVHERTHTGTKPYRCPISNCKKAFATGYGRKAHIRTHTGEKPYECTVCTKSFKTSGDLQKHVRTHTGERPFLCPVTGCGRRFTTSNIRKVHVRTHTGEKPYVCPELSCQRAFASATNYKNHIRIHTGEKPYVCQVKDCGKRFTEYSSLYKHALVHTHHRPYVCNLCPRRYRQVSNLSMHKRTFHGIVEADDGTQLVLSDAVVAISRNSKKIRGINCQNFLFNKENNTLIAISSENLPLEVEEEQEDANLEANEEESIGERDENSTSYLYLPQELIRLEYDFQEESENTSIENGESIIIDSLSMETD